MLLFLSVYKFNRECESKNCKKVDKRLWRNVHLTFCRKSCRQRCGTKLRPIETERAGGIFMLSGTYAQSKVSRVSKCAHILLYSPPRFLLGPRNSMLYDTCRKQVCCTVACSIVCDNTRTAESQLLLLIINRPLRYNFFYCYTFNRSSIKSHLQCTFSIICFLFQVFQSTTRMTIIKVRLGHSILCNNPQMENNNRLICQLILFLILKLALF